MSALLFCCLFAAQSAVLVVGPILPDVARDLGVSHAAVGQLRAISGVVGGVCALLIGFGAVRVSLPVLLRAGLLLTAGGALVSAAAPSYVVLAGAQAAIGAGVTALLSAGIAAAGAWTEPADRGRVLAWAIVGQPASWVAGMPIVGVVSGVSWRLAWVAVPFAAALVALLALRLVAAGHADAPAPRSAAGPRQALGDRRVLGWALGELCSNGAWAGVLVYVGALLIDRYALSAATVSVLLGAAALAYFPGTFAARRAVGGDQRALLATFALLLAVGTAALGGSSPGPAASTAIFTVLVLIVGARSLLASAFGMDAAPEHKVAVMSLRAAAMQFGYLLGAGLGGLALSVGGYAGLAGVLAGLFALGAAPHLAALTAGGTTAGARPALDALRP